MYYIVVWYSGWHEHIHAFESEAEAESFIDDTGMDPEEFDIVESEGPYL